MEQITLRFDRVFDIVRPAGRREPTTQFSFQAGPVLKYAVAIPGSPRIEAGMTITAVLEEAGNWQSLLGWLCHETGEIACRGVLSEAMGFVVVPVGAGWVVQLWPTSHVAALLVATLAGGLVFACVQRMREARLARRLLETRKAELDRPSAPASPPETETDVTP